MGSLLKLHSDYSWGWSHLEVFPHVWKLGLAQVCVRADIHGLSVCPHMVGAVFPEGQTQWSEVR